MQRQRHLFIGYGDTNMAFDRFLIAPIEGGLQTDLKPWLIPDDAFSRLNNAYIFRGRLRKRFGSILMNADVAQAVAPLYSRLSVFLGNADANGEFPFTAIPGEVLNVGSMFSVGDEMFTVTTVPSVVGNATTLSTTGASTGTVRLDSTGPNVYQFRASGVNLPLANEVVYWYPATPVMGFITYYNGDPLGEPTYAFDQQFSYQFTNNEWARFGTAIWTGSNSDFFWGTTWTGALPSDKILFVTNDTEADGIKYWDGTVWTDASFEVESGIFLDTCRMLVVYKNRLVALNTVENGLRYDNRARWASYGNPFRVNGWRKDLSGNGSALDAGTEENIISCAFVRDRLIVFFEESTWELAYTGNDAQPFAWQKLNSNLGADSTFSAVPLDRVSLVVGNVGIHACDGRGVERIDDKIPDTIWEAKDDNSGVDRIHGIFDYFAEQVYWTFPNIDTNEYSSTFPNRVLVYNFVTKSWAFNDDSLTCFGYYFARSASAVNWDSTEVTWSNNQVSWDSGFGQSGNQDIIAGNQQGYIVVINPFQTSNAPALQITNLDDTGTTVRVTCYDHNMNVNEFVNLQFLNGLTGPFNGAYKIVSIISEDQFDVDASDILAALQAGQTYIGGGVISRLSRIDISTKQYNFYSKEDRNSYVQMINFLVDRTESGEVMVDYMLGSSTQGNVSSAASTGALLGTSVLETSAYSLYPQEQTQERLWHPVYTQADGNAVQLRIYLSDEQLADLDIANSWFQLHAMMFYAVKTTSRQQ